MTAGSPNGGGSLKGKVALVTGASRGIGRAIALELACRGAAVALNYRASQAEAESLAERIKEIGSEALLVQGDVAKREEAREVVRRVLDHFGRLDILVNNAGITRDKSLRKMADDDWADVINVNLNGTYYCTSAALPSMIDQKFGRIINISSVVGQSGNFGQANYAASKGGIASFTKTLALEMARYNITANTVAPGFTCTEMLQKIPANILEQIRAKIPLGRFAMPEDVAKAVAFLAADGDYITGQQLSVNGGIYMI
ncbi:MAG: 3-oxoacyl-[acyl-carrier-protein] reductase [Rhodospirillales bacterium]